MRDEWRNSSEYKDACQVIKSRPLLLPTCFVRAYGTPRPRTRSLVPIYAENNEDQKKKKKKKKAVACARFIYRCCVCCALAQRKPSYLRAARVHQRSRTRCGSVLREYRMCYLRETHLVRAAAWRKEGRARGREGGRAHE